VSDPLVTVVMPAHNAERFIAEALASALAQTYAPVELIVVDDGSTDRTAQIAAAHGIKALTQARGGPAAARNAGLERARGEYWAILDADDLMPPEALERQVAELERDPELAMAFGMTEAFVTPGEPRPAHWNPATARSRGTRRRCWPAVSCYSWSGASIRRGGSPRTWTGWRGPRRRGRGRDSSITWCCATACTRATAPRTPRPSIARC